MTDRLVLDCVPDAFNSIRLVATDMDGTLTQNGKFTPALIQALEDLRVADIQVVIVTGRSAGWVNGVMSYLPVKGAIAENGGVYFFDADQAPERLVAIPDLLIHRQKLAQTFQQLRCDFPQLREAPDNAFRLTDWTFDVAGLSLEELAVLRDRCLEQGWSFTYSTVQCHIKPLEQEKASGLSQVLAKYFSEYAIEQVVTVGDSPNDESLFEGDRFPLSVGVANVLHYQAQMQHFPTYVTPSAEATGFCELAHLLLKKGVNGL